MKPFITICCAALVGAALISCSAGTATTTPTGELALMFDRASILTLTPDADLTPDSYHIVGSGPGEESFDTTTTSSFIELQDVAIGDWLVTVYALNAEGSIVGLGENDATIQNDALTTLEISIVPVDGDGMLSIAVEWDPTQVDSPSIQGSLVPPTGTDMPLTFNLADGTATTQFDQIPAGYYTLVLQVQDNGILVMGAVETVRIAPNSLTSGSFVFQDVNQPGGDILINMTVDMRDPLAVSISGPVGSLAQGTDMTATASVTDFTDNVVYAWYLNGTARATGSSYTLGSTLEPGFYRLDVTAFSADGTRAGSASHEFTVVQ